MDKSDKKETKYPLKLYLRIRPQRNGKQELLDFYKPKDEKEMHIDVPNDSINFKNGRINGDFSYEHIFLPNSTQECVFDVTTKSMLDGFLSGTSCLIMAYGVTGSGKTYTIMGPKENEGIVPRALQHIISGMNSMEFKERYKNDLNNIGLEMSFLEDYQDNIYDLLSPSPRIGMNTKPSLEIRVDQQNINRVARLTEKPIKTVQEGMELFELGTREKHMAETSLNVDSSRSHTVCTFNLVQSQGVTKRILASCRIVDLAGSERSSRTNVSGERTKEAGAINNDLLYLMQYLRVFSEGNRNNLSRNCKLIRMLSDYMNGCFAGPVHMIINASNDRCDFDETFNVLEQTTIVKSISSVQTKINTKLDPVLRTAGGRRVDLIQSLQRPANGADIERYKRMIQQLKTDYDQLKNNYDRDLQAAVEATEIQVRQEIVQEIQRRQQNGESENSQITALIESMKSQYVLMEEQLKERNKAVIEDYQRTIQEMQNQLYDIEEENTSLSDQLSILSGGASGNPATYEELLERTEALYTENKENQQLVKELRLEISQMKEESKKDPNQKQILDLEKKNEELVNENKRLSDSMNEMTMELKKLKEENQVLKTEKEKAEEMLTKSRFDSLKKSSTIGQNTSIKKVDSAIIADSLRAANNTPSTYNSNSLKYPMNGYNSNSLPRALQLNKTELSSSSPLPRIPPINTQSPPRIGSPRKNPGVPSQRTNLGVLSGSPRGSPTGSPRGSPIGSPRGSPLGASRGSPIGSPRGSPQFSPLPYDPQKGNLSRSFGASGVSSLSASMGSPHNPSRTVPSSFANTSVSQLNGSRNFSNRVVKPPAISTKSGAKNLNIEISSPNSEKSRKQANFFQ